MEPYYDDDDGYDDDYYDKDNSSEDNLFKWYFKIDVSQGKSLGDWIKDQLNDFLQEDWLIDNVTGQPVLKFPVNSWNPDTGSEMSLQYLGSNYQGSPIYKKKHIDPKVHREYLNHITSHAKWFVLQPHYYNGMFDILN